MGAELDLDLILATARAAKEETSSGAWCVGERHWRHTVVSKPGEITSRDDSPYCIVSANTHFESRATLEHIASANPDTIIALVERLQQLDAENNELQRERYEAQARIQRMERGNTGSAEPKPNGE